MDLGRQEKQLNLQVLSRNVGKSIKKIQHHRQVGRCPRSLRGHQPREWKVLRGVKECFQCHSKDKLYQRRHRSEPHRWSRCQTESRISKFIKTRYQECLQGDMMYSDDLSSDNIDGVNYITFTPNTITYAVPTDRSCKEIVKSKMGISSTPNMLGRTCNREKASFGPDISYLKKTAGCLV